MIWNRFMRPLLCLIGVNFLLGMVTTMTYAQTAPLSPNGNGKGAPKPVDVTADKSLEWYQDQRIYVARGNAKAIRGDLVVEADILTAHERERPKSDKTTVKTAPKTATKTADNTDAGDIDKMTAEGHVRITNPKQQVTGDHAVYDLIGHYMVVTGNNLRYVTAKDIVTAKDSLEYWEDKKIAVARGNAEGIRDGRHVKGDVLTAEFRDTPSGEQELWKMTSEGHVTVVTKTDFTNGDRMVYDVARNIAVVSGHVHITRQDGTQLSGDVGEVDFANNQSRLLNEGHGRVHALLQSKSTAKTTTSKTTAANGAP